jgi:hypothetical protein
VQAFRQGPDHDQRDRSWSSGRHRHVPDQGRLGHIGRDQYRIDLDSFDAQRAQ